MHTIYMRAPGLIDLNQVELLEIESHIFYAILDSVQFLASYRILSPIIAILIQMLLIHTYNVHKGSRPNSAVPIEGLGG